MKMWWKSHDWPKRFPWFAAKSPRLALDEAIPDGELAAESAHAARSPSGREQRKRAPFVSLGIADIPSLGGLNFVDPAAPGQRLW